MKEYRIEYTIFNNMFEFYVMAENKKEAEKKFIDLRGKQLKITNIEEIEEMEDFSNDNSISNYNKELF